MQESNNTKRNEAESSSRTARPLVAASLFVRSTTDKDTVCSDAEIQLQITDELTRIETRSNRRETTCISFFFKNTHLEASFLSLFEIKCFCVTDHTHTLNTTANRENWGVPFRTEQCWCFVTGQVTLWVKSTQICILHVIVSVIDSVSHRPF